MNAQSFQQAIRLRGEVLIEKASEEKLCWHKSQKLRGPAIH